MKLDIDMYETSYLLTMIEEEISKTEKLQINWYGEDIDFETPTILQQKIARLKSLKERILNKAQETLSYE